MARFFYCTSKPRNIMPLYMGKYNHAPRGLNIPGDIDFFEVFPVNFNLFHMLSGKSVGNYHGAPTTA
jgi:hypothetical protein